MSQNPPMLLQLTCPAFYDDGQAALGDEIAKWVDAGLDNGDEE